MRIAAIWISRLLDATALLRFPAVNAAMVLVLLVTFQTSLANDVVQMPAEIPSRRNLINILEQLRHAELGRER